MAEQDFQDWTGGTGTGSANPFENLAQTYGQYLNDWTMLAQSVMAQGAAGGVGMDAWRAYAQPFAQMMGGAAQAAPLGGFVDPRAGAQGAVAPELSALMQLVAQAHMQIMASGFRHWNGMAELYRTKYVNLAGQIMSGAGGARDLGYLIDEARSYLRQVSELSLKEGRVLQAELEKVEYQINQIVGEDAQAEGPRRHWKAKP